MGFVSYHGDIQERIDRDLDALKSRLRSLKIADTEHKQLLIRVNRVRERCNALLTQVDEAIDLATDPNVDLAYQIKAYEAENVKLKAGLLEVDARVLLSNLTWPPSAGTTTGQERSLITSMRWLPPIPKREAV